MKLTEDQIDLIDRFLEQKNLDFMDFKIEIKDHLACEIEDTMQKENNAFEDSFRKVLENWQEEFKNTKTWIISNEREFPAFIANKIKNNVIVHYTTVIVLVFFLCLGYLYLKDNFIQSHDYLRYTIGFCGVLYLFLRNLMNRTKFKTSYRFHFDYFYVNTLLAFVLLFVFDINVNVSIIFGLILLADFPFSIYYFFKHQRFIKKNNLA
jgi:hypothetical protein